MPSDLERLLQALTGPKRQSARRSSLIIFTEALLLHTAADVLTSVAGTAGSAADLDDDLCVGLASP